MSRADAERGSKSSPRGTLVVVCGLPGSGKTTTARRIAVERGGVRPSPDEWMTVLGASLWDSQLRSRVVALQWALGQDLLRTGATVIVEWGTWGRAERDTLRARARELGAAVELVYLNVPLEELWRRIQARGLEDPPIQRSDLDCWWDSFQAPTEEEQELFDPSP